MELTIRLKSFNDLNQRADLSSASKWVRDNPTGSPGTTMKLAMMCQNFPPAIFEGGSSHYSLQLAKAFKGGTHKLISITSTKFTNSNKGNEERSQLQIRPVQGPWNCKSIGEIRKTALTKKTSFLFANPNQAMSMGSKGREAVQKRFTPEIHVGRLLSIFEDEIKAFQTRAAM